MHCINFSLLNCTCIFEYFVLHFFYSVVLWSFFSVNYFFYFSEIYYQKLWFVHSPLPNCRTGEEVQIHRLSGCNSWDRWSNLLNTIDRVNR